MVKAKSPVEKSFGAGLGSPGSSARSRQAAATITTQAVSKFSNKSSQYAIIRFNAQPTVSPNIRCSRGRITDIRWND
jgi:hypothetical protein